MNYKRIIKIFKYLIISLAIIIVVVLIAVNLPFGQRLISEKANRYFIKNEIPVQVDRITLLLNGKIGLRRVQVLDNKHDTIVFAEKINVSARLFPIIFRKVIVKNITIQNAVIRISMDSLIHKPDIISLFIKDRQPSSEVKKQGKKWEINARSVSLGNVRFRYNDPGKGILIEQSIGNLNVEVDDFSLIRKVVYVSYLELDRASGGISINQSPDTTDIKRNSGNSAPWDFKLRKSDIREVLFFLEQPGKNNKLDFSIGKGEISSAAFNLEKMSISAERAEIINGSFHQNYLLEETPRIERNNLLQVDGLNTSIKNIRLTRGESGFSMESLSLNLGNGFSIIKGELIVSSDSVNGSRIRSELKTAASRLNISVEAESLLMNIFRSFRQVPFTLKIEDSMISAEEIFAFLPGLKEQSSLKNKEDIMVGVNTEVSGTTENLKIDNFRLDTSTGLSILLSGNVKGILNPSSGFGSLYFRTGTITPSQVKDIAGLAGLKAEIPDFDPITIEGNIDSSLTRPYFNVTIKGNSGYLGLTGDIDIPGRIYDLRMNFKGIEAGKLSGVSELGRISGKLDLKGTEFVPEIMELKAALTIDSARFRNYDYRGIKIVTGGSKGVFSFDVNSEDVNFKCALKGLADIKVSSLQVSLSGLLDTDAGKLNLFKGTSVSTSLEAELIRSSDALEGSMALDKIVVIRDNMMEDLNNVTFSFKSSDTVSSGKVEADFLKAEAYYKGSLADFKKVLDKGHLGGFAFVDSAVGNNIPYLSAISDIKIFVESQYDPFIGLFVDDSVFSYNRISVSVLKDTSGVANAEVWADRINAGKSDLYGTSIIIESLPRKSELEVKVDSLKLGRMFFSDLGSGITVEGDSALFSLRASSMNDSLIYDIKGKALRDQSGIRLSSTNENWVINGWSWSISGGDFLVLDPQNKDFNADLHLKNESHSIDIYGRKSEKIFLETEDVSLKMILIPGLENFRYDATFTGNADFRSKDGENEFGVKMDINAIRMDEVLLGYMNLSGSILSDTSGNRTSNFNAIINDTSEIRLNLMAEGGSGEKAIHTEFSDIQIRSFEPFISKYVSGLQGLLTGNLDIVQKDNKPEINGEMSIKGVRLKLIPVNSWYYLTDDNINIEHNILRFTRFTVLDSMRNPLTLSGSLNLGDRGNIVADLQIASDHIQVMNTTDMDNAEFNGDIFINSAINFKGPLHKPSISGNIVLAKGSVINYKYAENLSVSETQKTIIFASLKQDGQADIKPMPASGQLSGTPDIEATVVIDPSSLFNFQISKGFDISVSITGGGFLTYSLMPSREINLSGIYEIIQGESELKIPGWPRKDFVITKGSTVRWDGKIDDPDLNIETTSKVRGSYVNPVDNMTREVNFIVYMKLAGRFSDLGIVFDLRSEDQYLTTFFNTLSTDERMKQAINLLIFERVELPGQKSSSNYLTQQISQFAENQINQATKSASKMLDLDVSVGLDTYTQSTTTGEQTTTSLSYQVKKNMFNDRGSVLLSGHANSNTTSSDQSSAVIENFIFEYAVDSNRTKFLKVYRQQNYEDLLEGEVIKSGVGFIYRKNYDRISDIWRRQKRPKK